jgi:hypothetical protein
MEDFDSLLGRMPDIAKAVERFSSENVQLRALDALIGAFENVPDPSERSSETQAFKTQKAPIAAKPQRPMKKTANGKKAPSKSKSSFTVVKDLDLVSGGKPPFKEFLEGKKLKSAFEKCLIAVYWLSKNTKNPKPVTVDQVYTIFKYAGWPVPSNLVNTIQQAGSKGWLDSHSSSDIRVVVAGENHVEHEMIIKNEKA